MNWSKSAEGSWKRKRRFSGRRGERHNEVMDGCTWGFVEDIASLRRVKKAKICCAFLCVRPRGEQLSQFLKA